MKAFQRWRERKSSQNQNVKVLAPEHSQGNGIVKIESERGNGQKISKSISSSALLNDHQRYQQSLQDRRFSSSHDVGMSKRKEFSTPVSQFYSPSRIRFDSLVTGKQDRPPTTSMVQNGKSVTDADLSSDLRALSKKPSSSSFAGKKVAETPVIVVGQTKEVVDHQGVKVARKHEPGAGRQNGFTHENSRPAKSTSSDLVPDPKGADGGNPLTTFERRPSSISQQSSSRSVSNNGLRPAAIHIDATSPAWSSNSSNVELDANADLSRNARQADRSWDAESLKRAPTLSLKKSKDRLSGMLGTWKRNPSTYPSEQKSPGCSQVDNNGIASTASKSQTLAIELNELAVAFDEGLLGEEEYRMLRKGVFDKMMTQGDMEIPKESTLRASQTSPAELSGGGVNGDDNQSHLTSSRRSGRSANLRSIFRSNSQSSQSLVNGKGPMSSDRSTFSSIAGSRFGPSNAIKEQSILQEQYSQARRARTLRGVSSMNALESASLHKQAGSSLDYRSTGNGVPSSAKSAQTEFSSGGISISTGTGLLGGSYGEKTSAQIAAEMAVVEAEKKRMLDNFKTLEVQAIGRYNLTFEQIRQASASAEREAKASTGTGRLLNSSAYPPSSAKRAEAVRRASSRDEVAQVRTLSDDSGESALRNELVVVLKKRADVSAKYDDRLAFLRSSMRSAKIREGLR